MCTDDLHIMPGVKGCVISWQVSKCLGILPAHYPNPISDIPYSRICVIYVLRPCALGFGLRSVRDIYSLKMALGVLSISIVGYCFTV